MKIMTFIYPETLELLKKFSPYKPGVVSPELKTLFRESKMSSA